MPIVCGWVMCAMGEKSKYHICIWPIGYVDAHDGNTGRSDGSDAGSHRADGGCIWIVRKR